MVLAAVWTEIRVRLCWVWSVGNRGSVVGVGTKRFVANKTEGKYICIYYQSILLPPAIEYLGFLFSFSFFFSLFSVKMVMN